MSNVINTTRNPRHYLEHLMGLSVNEIRDMFTPIFDDRREKRENSEFLESLEDDLADIIFMLDKKGLSKESLFSFSASKLLNYLLNAELHSELEAHSKSLKLHGDLLKNSIEIIESLLQQQKNSAEQDKSVAKAYFALKEDVQKLSDEQIRRSINSSNNAKLSNPTPPNTVEHFYTCAEMIIELDTGNRLYLKDVAELARNELLDKVADYELEWKKEDPFKLKWFHERLKEHPSLPEYLRSNEGKNAILRKETINNIKVQLGS